MMTTIEKTPKISNWFASDDEFNQLYNIDLQYLANRHWTPTTVAKRASAFLAAEPGNKILDIGSGVGKFCLTGAYYHPDAFFFGIEQRKKLVESADYVKCLLELKNASFIHGNFTKLSLNKFDHFYFYNSFYENLDGTAKIDDSIAYSGELYNYYNAYLFKQLELV
ncbi:MAG TPA: methyltransferase domain-containing protein, partial [Puia sp.]|nr:methyltransferase domain-containing protein [Puia sp.]